MEKPTTNLYSVVRYPTREEAKKLVEKLRKEIDELKKEK